jgi:hypothetical protein
MAQIIRFPIERTRQNMRLRRARQYLGRKLFNQAMHEWSMRKLEATMDHPECWVFGSFPAYEAIHRHRKSQYAPACQAEVVKLAA